MQSAPQRLRSRGRAPGDAIGPLNGSQSRSISARCRLFDDLITTPIRLAERGPAALRHARGGDVCSLRPIVRHIIQLEVSANSRRIRRCSGGTANFTVVPASKEQPLSYQWQQNNSKPQQRRHYQRVTTGTLTHHRRAGQPHDAANLRCIRPNAYGATNPRTPADPVTTPNLPSRPSPIQPANQIVCWAHGLASRWGVRTGTLPSKAEQTHSPQNAALLRRHHHHADGTGADAATPPASRCW